MVAPKCPGTEVREEYKRGFGVPTVRRVGWLALSWRWHGDSRSPTLSSASSFPPPPSLTLRQPDCNGREERGERQTEKTVQLEPQKKAAKDGERQGKAPYRPLETSPALTAARSWLRAAAAQLHLPHTRTRENPAWRDRHSGNRSWESLLGISLENLS